MTTKTSALLAALGWALAVVQLIAGPAGPAQAMDPDLTPTHAAMVAAGGLSTPSPSGQVRALGGLALGWAGQIQCYNCAPFSAKAHLTNYDPMSGPINCWDFQDGYCYSPMASGVHWKSFYGLGAACPIEWPYGTWVEIPEVGVFICLDRGGAVVCNDQGVCNVDIMGPGGASWNGQDYDVTLWVPLNPPRAE